MVSSPAELDQVLGSRRAPTSWVVKSPFSAAGRGRYIERSGPPLSEPKARRTVERLFARHGALLFEPWMDRLADFGVAAFVLESGARIAGVHRQVVDAKGQFAGIDLDHGLAATELIRLQEIAAAVGEALRRAGYVGPFGIDAWTHRRPDGEVVLHPLGEINARFTFGWVARALAERVRLPGSPGDVPRRLRLAKALPRQGSRIVPLLSAGRRDGPAAWLETAAG